MPLLATMLPPAQAAIADEETRPEPDQSQEHIPTPLRSTTSDQIPPVFEQGHTLDPIIASFSGAHESDPDLFTSINVEDETLGGSFHTTPPRSTQVPLVGPTSGGDEDLATLTALSSLVSELVQKVSTLESELKAHKLLFTDIVPKLVKKVKALEVNALGACFKTIQSFLKSRLFPGDLDQRTLPAEQRKPLPTVDQLRNAFNNIHLIEWKRLVSCRGQHKSELFQATTEQMILQNNTLFP
ncbi:hypothetical protein Tco_1568424 [Tanacetum coccineum]